MRSNRSHPGRPPTSARTWIRPFAVLAFAFLVSSPFLAGRADDFVDDDALTTRLKERLEEYDSHPDKVPVAILKSGLEHTNAPVRLTRPRTGTRSWSELYPQARRSVLIVGQLYVCPTCHRRHVATATGFMVSADGVLVTNYHVLEEDRGGVFGALAYDGTFYPIREGLAGDPLEDLALFRLVGTGFVPLPVLADKPVGSPVGVLSHPNSAYFSLTTGVISRYALEAPRGNGPFRRHQLVITADYAKGSSGGPVLDTSGNVVGVASATESVYSNNDHGRQENLQQVVKICVPARFVRRLIVTPK